MAGILDGIRVLDFGRYIAGPYCAALLSDLDAEVIRIEKVKGSEDRFVMPMTEDGSDDVAGAQFLQMNRNKLGFTLNPMKDEGREIVRRLVETADVVIANLPPATLEAMGLDYPTLCKIKPDIILTTVSAFGRGGPYSDRVGFDGIGQVMSGSAYLTGEPGHPTKAYVPWVDFGTASLCAFGTMAALFERQKTGKGQQVEGALLATALSFFNFNLIEQSITNVNRIASGNRSQTSGPADIYKAKDGSLLAWVVGQPLFERWAHLMGDADTWLNDPRFADDAARGDNGEVLSARMSEWCAERTVDEALAALEEARIPAGPVLSPAHVLKDPHVEQVGFLQNVNYPNVPGPAPVAKTPVQFSETPADIRNRAPQLGEHTEQIMKELGYSDDDIRSLREKRVV